VLLTLAHSPHARADWHHLCARISQKGGIAVASLEYRLAPEHPFPAGLEDAHAAMLWVANGDHASLAVCGQPGKRKVVIAGDSAGGNISAALALLARDGKNARLEPAPVVPLDHVVLVYPSMSVRARRGRVRCKLRAISSECVAGQGSLRP
jgi:acetyl esterase/lipase